MSLLFDYVNNPFFEKLYSQNFQAECFAEHLKLISVIAKYEWQMISYFTLSFEEFCLICNTIYNISVTVIQLVIATAYDCSFADEDFLTIWRQTADRDLLAFVFSEVMTEYSAKFLIICKKLKNLKKLNKFHLRKR